jgi:hypothetical protein
MSVWLALEFGELFGFESLGELFNFAFDVKLRIERKVEKGVDLTDEEMLAYFMASVINNAYDVLISRGFGSRDSIKMIKWAIKMYGEDKKFTQEELSLLRSIPSSWYSGSNGFCVSGLRYTVCANPATSIVEYIDTFPRESVIVRIRRELPEFVRLVEALKRAGDIDSYVKSELIWLDTCRRDKLLCPSVEFAS